MTNLFKDKITVYIEVPQMAEKPRYWVRRVVDKCNINNGLTTCITGTVHTVVNATTVITKDVDHYLPPTDFYKATDNENVYTVNTGDFIVFGEVDDVVDENTKITDLQQKYKSKSIKAVTVSPCINGMSVDNISVTNV